MHAIFFFYFVLVTALFAQTPSYTISTIAGTNPSGDNGRAKDARLLSPEGVLIDAQSNLYFCDRGNARIRRVARDQTITTVAGGGETVNVLDGQPATSVRLFDPVGIALNAATNTLYFSDYIAHTVYSVNLTSGSIAILAGTGTAGGGGDGGSAKRANLNGPRGLAYDPALGVLIADRFNHRIRRVDLTSGVISVFAGTGTRGFLGDGAGATAAQLSSPHGVSIGPDRVVYIADWGNSRIRRVRADGTMDTVAGTGSTRFAGDNALAISAAVDGYHVTAAPDGTLYLAEQSFQRIRRITPAGIITTIAGTGTYGFSGDGGLGTIAKIDSPAALALDTSGGLYIADALNNRVRRLILSSSLIDTVAGANRFGGDGLAAPLALLTDPKDVSYDGAGNLYFADTGNHCIRRIGRDGIVNIVAGIGGEAGEGAESIAATASRLDRPSAVVADADGSFYIADRGNLRIRKVDPNGIVRTISGNDFFFPQALALQSQQRRLYFTDGALQQVLRIDLANPAAIPVAVAGSPNFRAGFSGDGGPALAAFLRSPEGIAFAPNGDLYIVDAGNSRLRRIDSAGVITTVAGNGELEFSPSDGPLTNSVLSFPTRIAINAQGNIFISEGFGRIRLISGTRIDTIAGQSLLGFSGDGGPARQANLDGPTGLALATDGSLIVADTNNHRLRRLSPTTTPAPAVAARLEIRSGNNQSGTVGQLLPQALTVAALTGSSLPVPATAVAFAVTAGTATLSAATVNTGSDGLASITVILGTAVGTVQITARSGTLTPVVFSLTNAATQPPPVTVVRPVIARGGIIGVGFSVPAVTSISPRGIIAIAGQNFLEPGVTGRRVDFATETVAGLLPTRLLGVCVEIGGIRAPMLDVFGTQLDVIVPAVSGTSVAVRVIRRCDQPDAVTSDPETVSVSPAAPEFLYSQLNADGRNPVAAINAITGTLIGPATLPGFTPAAGGDIVTIFATGFGATNPAIAAGGTSPGIANVTATAKLLVGAVELSPADILYVGTSPGSLIYQVNFRVPAGLAEGNLPVQIILNGVASPPNAYLAISPAAN